MRPFYKSRLFWCGVPGLVFLLWVWWDSGGHSSSLHWNRGSREYDLSVMEGVVMGVNAADTPKVSRFSGHRGELLVDHAGPKGLEKRVRQFDFPEAVDWWSVDNVQGMRVALWVMVAGYAVVWLSVVAGWERRRANAEHPTPNIE